MELENTAPELTEFLDKPLESQKRTVEQNYEDDVDSEDSELAGPITPETKNKILRLAAALTHTDPKTYLPLIEKLRNMTENEALLYLECLEASVNQEAYTGITQMALESVADLIIHPEDKETKIALVNDPIVRKLAGQECGNMLSTAGKAGLFIILSFYAVTSWSRRKFQSFARFQKPPPKPTLSDVGGGAESVRKDNSDGKVNAGAVDSPV